MAKQDCQTSCETVAVWMLRFHTRSRRLHSMSRGTPCRGRRRGLCGKPWRLEGASVLFKHRDVSRFTIDEIRLMHRGVGSDART